MSILHPFDPLAGSVNPQPADLVIEELARSEAELIERVQSLEADVEIYAALAKQALQQLHEKTRDGDRYQWRILRLVAELKVSRDEVRALGGQLRAWQERAA